MEVGEVAEEILRCEGDFRPAYRVADPSIYKVDGGPSIAERFVSHGVVFRRGDNSRHVGYVEVRARIAGTSDGPMLYSTNNCHHGFWRTMPDLVMDEHKHGIKSEDVDTDQEDHCYDEVRYACMSRPWARHIETKAPVAERWMRFEEQEEESWKTA